MNKILFILTLLATVIIGGIGSRINAQIACKQNYDAVFIGNSITDFWDGWVDDSARTPDGKPVGHSAFFNDNHYLNVGIGGNVTAEMLERFERDVLTYNPKVVVIMGGTNDLERINTCSLEDIIANTAEMIDMAKNADIKVILCSVTPTSSKDENGDARPVKTLNTRLEALAGEKQIEYADYYSMLQVGDTLPDIYCADAVLDKIHLSNAAYTLMEPYIKGKIDTLIGSPTPPTPLTPNDKVAYLSTYATLDDLVANGSDDEAAAATWLVNEYGGHFLSTANVAARTDTLYRYKAIWIDVARDMGYTDFPAELKDPVVLGAIEAYYKSGGNLFLSTFAVKLLSVMGRSDSGFTDIKESADLEKNGASYGFVPATGRFFARKDNDISSGMLDRSSDPLFKCLPKHSRKIEFDDGFGGVHPFIPMIGPGAKKAYRIAWKGAITTHPELGERWYDRVENITFFENDYNMEVLGTLEFFLGYSSLNVGRWLPFGVFAGKAVTLGETGYEWHQNSGANVHQQNIIQLTINILDELSFGNPDLDSVIKAKGNLTWELIRGSNVKEDSVTDNLILPTSLNGADVNWTSNDTALVKTNGAVIRPVALINSGVRLTATITKGDAAKIVTFDMIVIKEKPEANNTVAYVSTYATLQDLIARGDDDEAAAATWLVDEYGGDFISTSEIAVNPAVLDDYKVLWIDVARHLGFSNFPTELTTPAVLNALTDYHKAGGNLLLTTYAVKLFNYMNRIDTASSFNAAFGDVYEGNEETNDATYGMTPVVGRFFQRNPTEWSEGMLDHTDDALFVGMTKGTRTLTYDNEQFGGTHTFINMIGPGIKEARRMTFLGAVAWHPELEPHASDKIDNVNLFYSDYGGTPVACIEFALGYIGFSIVRWDSKWDFQGRAISIHETGYEWHQNGTANPYQNNIIQLTANALNELAMEISNVDRDSVLAAMNDITWDLIRGENVMQNSVTSNLVLPTRLHDCSIVWESDNTDIVSISGAVTRPAADVYVTVQATVTRGITVEKAPSFLIKVLKANAAIEENLRNRTSFKVYPNPAKDVLNISGAAKSVEIYDMQGKVVLRSNKTSVNIEGLPAGAYTVKSGSSMQKFVKK
jgi:lysophospholipase L1-like esterase